MSYEFVKVYADLVGNGDTVLFVYQAWARLLGSWHARGGIELYASGGWHRSWHARITSTPPTDSALGRSLEVHLPQGMFRLVLEPSSTAFEPDTQPCPGLQWRVLAGRAIGRTQGLARVAGKELPGTGYADWVRIVRPTRLLGLRRLSWGRAHLPRSSIVFNAIELADGRHWSSTVQWSADGNRQSYARAGIEINEDGGGRVAFGAQRLELEPLRVLVRGSSFSAERLPGVLERGVARLVGGATRESRWLGTGRLAPLASDAPDAEAGSALYECVSFG